MSRTAENVRFKTKISLSVPEHGRTPRREHRKRERLVPTVLAQKLKADLLDLPEVEGVWFHVLKDRIFFVDAKRGVTKKSLKAVVVPVIRQYEKFYREMAEYLATAPL